MVAGKDGVSFSTICGAVASEIVAKFAETSKRFWQLRVMSAVLEPNESPEELAQRLTAYNDNAGGDVSEATMLSAFIEAIEGGGDVNVAAAMSGMEKLKEAAAAAQKMWKTVRKVAPTSNSKTETSAKTKVKVAAVSSASAMNGEGATMNAEGCYYCGQATTPKHGYRSCPEMLCLGCRLKGHMLSDCPNKTLKKYSAVPARTTATEAKWIAGARRVKSGRERIGAAKARASAAAAVQAKRKDKRLFARVTVGGMQTAALMDNGAECSVISSGQLQHLRFEKVEAPFDKIEGISASGAINVIYGAKTTVVVGSVSVVAILAVVEEAHVPDGLLLGVDVLEKLGLMDALRAALEGIGAEIILGATTAHVAEAMGADYGAATGETVHDEDRYEAAEAIDQVDLSHLDDVPDLRDELRGVLHANRLAFLRDGRLPEAAAIPPVSIRVQGPPVIVAQRPWSAEAEKRIAEHERLLVKDGVARWVDSSAWRGEPLLVWKPDGSTRYTGDYRKANRSIVMDSYPTASLPEELRRMAGGHIFSSFDFRHGFWQVPVAVETQEPSTQRSAVKALLVFERLPMGYNTSPALFTRAVRTYLVDELLPDVRERTAQYMDDLGHSSVGERRVAVKKEIAAIKNVLETVSGEGEVRAGTPQVQIRRGSNGVVRVRVVGGW